MTIDEGDLRFDFSQALSLKKFDGENHGLAYCMKAVDFVVELEDKILFIEVKDPDDPRSQASEDFGIRLNSEEYIKDKLVGKCRDSFLYEYGYSNVSKPVHYSVVVGLSSLSEPLLLAITELLRHHIPVEGPPGRPWPRRFIENCMVFSLETWNRLMPDFQVSRISRSGNE